MYYNDLWERSQKWLIIIRSRKRNMDNLKLEDIAKLAGVSRSTVSRVVNDSPHVSAATRKRVEKIIQNNGYHPNAAARSLASQRTNMIGLVIPRSTSAFFTDPYFPQLTQGVAFACNNHHLTLSLFLVGNRGQKWKGALSKRRHKQEVQFTIYWCQLL